MQRWNCRDRTPPAADAKRCASVSCDGAAAALLMVLLAVASGARGQTRVEALFRNAEPGAASDGREVSENRRVRIDFEKLTAARAQVGDGTTGSLTLNLFDDVVFESTVAHTAPTLSGGYSLTGRLQGVAFGAMTLVVNDDVAAGTVHTPSVSYAIRPGRRRAVRHRAGRPVAFALRDRRARTSGIVPGCCRRRGRCHGGRSARRHGGTDR